MASYFVAGTALPDTPPFVHDRQRCPPGRFPREHAEYLAQTIPGASLHVLPEVSHFAPVQRPEVFNAAMLAFLAKVMPLR